MSAISQHLIRVGLMLRVDAAIALRLAVRLPKLVRGNIIARPAWVTADGPENMAPNADVGRLLEGFPLTRRET